jgi:hypothetical protein
MGLLPACANGFPKLARSLFDLVTARYERGSIIVTNNLSFTEWGAIRRRRARCRDARRPHTAGFTRGSGRHDGFAVQQPREWNQMVGASASPYAGTQP